MEGLLVFIVVGYALGKLARIADNTGGSSYAHAHGDLWHDHGPVPAGQYHIHPNGLDGPWALVDQPIVVKQPKRLHLPKGN